MTKKAKMVFACVLGIIVLICLVIGCWRIHRENERDTQTSCCGCLSQFSKALLIYSMDHGGQYPPDLTALALGETHYISQPRLYLCRGTRPYSKERVAQAFARPDYAYVAGLKESDPSGAVMLFCFPENHSGKGCNVARLDGSVPWFSTQEFTRLTNDPTLFFGTTNETMLADLKSRTVVIERGQKKRYWR
jgi:prepilin-type processing-associated H-X9-DG protein